MNTHIIPKLNPLQAAQTFVVLCIITMLSSCTHNNGDIGPVFGTWKLIAADCEGMDNPAEGKDMFWSFQNETIRIDLQSGPHDDLHSSYGNFRLADDTLFLSFPDKENPMPLPEFPADSEWQLLRLTRSELIVAYAFSEQQKVTFTFRKW